MVLSVRFDVSQLARIRAQVAQALTTWEDTTPLMEQIGLTLLLATQHRFETQKDPAGMDWRELNEAYWQWRVSKGYDGPKLRMTGELYRSLNIRARHGEVSLGSNKVYAAFQQFGSSDGKVPRRAYLPTDGLPRAEVEDIHALISDALTRGWQ